ncbi:MAG: bifunctional 4-hydroxy-2-oxoglutarate aldolase/2-dehydro-3-deoxy-phosphogluconate aldolase [Clostridia bacterium]|nr:bifunctional 4-hydroxy-2-oxoglutarate aldolase/2-dehydro-3-deoxy-phosphogluconate aldolase [Clostridia bacterium]
MRNAVIESVTKEKLIVIVRGVPREKLVPLAEAMYAGGVRLLEITFSQDGSVSDEETADRIAMLATAMSGKMFIGAGTVTKESQVALVKEAGGLFIISPDTCEGVIKKTREAGLVSMPGALTPTEAMTAHRAGADFVKLFPILDLGPAYLKAVRAPLSGIKFLAVGGVDLGNVKDFLKAGASGFGIGSGIVKGDLIKAEKYGEITELARAYVAAVSN